jgi:hypothetical protein
MVIALPALGANAIVNGDMETGTATSPFVANWLVNGVAGGTTNTYVHDNTSPHGGLFSEQFTGASQGGGANAALFQITSPGSVSGNTPYTLNFWAKMNPVGPSGVGFYQVLYFDASNGIVGNTGSQNITGNASTWTLNSVNLVSPANTDHIQLEFDAIVGAIAGSSMTLNIDDVSFGTVPEPATLTVLAIGAGAMALRRRR